MRGLGCICDETDLNLSGSGGRIQIVTSEKETSGETVLGEVCSLQHLVITFSVFRCHEEERDPGQAAELLQDT